MWLLVLLACTPSDDGDTDTDAAADTDAAVDTDEPGPDDEAAARAAIAGERDLAEVLSAVAWRGGFPVPSSAGFLFLAEGTGWSIAGDFNGWVPSPMTGGEGLSWAEIPIAEPAGQRYKLVRDGQWHADPWARSYEHDENGEISFVAPPSDRPRIDRWPDLAGQDLLPRDVRVLVPPGEGPWPVLYVHDGQNVFDPAALHGGWRLDEAVAALARPILVVALDNTADRLDEYAHTEDRVGGVLYGGDADRYADLLQLDLRPHVEAVYGSTGLDGLLGSSMGGLASLYVAHAHPGAFDLAASLSGTLGWGRFAEANPTVEELYAAHAQTVLYVDSGGGAGGGGCVDTDGDGAVEDDPDDADNYCVNRAFADAMAARGYTWDQDLFHWHEPGATHDEAAWAARVDRPLEIFLGLQDAAGALR